MLDEEGRRNTLWNYYCTENTLQVNALHYNVAYYEREDGLFFAAYHYGKEEKQAMVLVPNELWEQLDCGLKIAYMYNCVLSQLEEVLRTT